MMTVYSYDQMGLQTKGSILKGGKHFPPPLMGFHEALIPITWK